MRLGDFGGNLKNRKGFSLLELLIVVAIILLVATIAIPSLLRSRQSANESAAVANMRNLNTAQVSYSSTNGTYGAMSNLIAVGLLDERYSAPNFNGYRFTLALSGNALDYTAYANGLSPNTSRYDFYSGPGFVIRYTTAASRAPAGMNGDPVQ